MMSLQTDAIVEADVICQVHNHIGFITLNRPKALNALTLGMIRSITAALHAWRNDASVYAVVAHSTSEKAFCAGGDIRFFHKAATTGNPQLEDFFTEEYTLNHLIHRYPKPYIALMDGVVMGGGMGISQGAGLRIVTERTKMAMPETNIGLFPDVGGGWFLSRCEGHIGEWLALTGHVLTGREAVYFDLADIECTAAALPGLIHTLKSDTFTCDADVTRTVLALLGDHGAEVEHERSESDFVDQLVALDDLVTQHFSLPTLHDIIQSLEGNAGCEWSQHTAATLRKRSPLMLHVVLEQVRRARSMTLSDDLRMERGLVRHCFHLRGAADSETVEGVRALAVDKDHAPKWQPARIEDVSREEVDAFFVSPWPAHAHPLKSLQD
jgi:enoyl-CoA hydratase